MSNRLSRCVRLRACCYLAGTVTPTCVFPEPAGDGTSANPDQRVAINLVAPHGTYQYWMKETEDYWIPDPNDPVDEGFWLTVTETRPHTAPMTARLVDVDGDLITGDVDPYFNDETSRIELRIAGFQPVFN